MMLERLPLVHAQLGGKYLEFKNVTLIIDKSLG